jgi:dihydroorotate dehydrogenase electron transfer subunit
VREVAAEFVDRFKPWDASVVIRLAVPDLGQVAPGQFVLLANREPFSRVQPVPLLPSAQLVGDSVDVLLPDVEAAADLDRALRLDRPLRVLGPAGRGFVVEGRTRRALLVGSGPGLGSLLMLTAVLLGRGLDVTFVWAGTGVQAMPAGALPPEVEYVTPEPERFLSSIEERVTWADALYLALPSALAPAVASLLRRRLLRLRKGFAQALLSPPAMPCGVGACDLCTVRTLGGYRRACRDGLVFDLQALA